jgi:DNA polymerase
MQDMPMNDKTALLTRFFQQERELRMPDYILSDTWDLSALLRPAGHDSASQPTGSTSAAAQTSATPGAQNRRNPAAGPSSGAGTQTPAPHTPKRTRLKRLYYQTKDCDKCALHKGRNAYVFGAGSVDAPCMVIGEAPGAEEDRQGLPFVGKAGTLLTKMLQSISLDRQKDAFITSICKCRPPHNRPPTNAERTMCMSILIAQIEIIRPRVILCLGTTAAHTLLERTETLSRLRTESHTVRGIPAFVTYHPAALLRNPSLKRSTYEDLLSCKRCLDTRLHDASAPCNDHS